MTGDQLNPVVEVENLFQKIGRQDIINGISFSIAAGKCMGIFGMRGTGKTTLLHIIAGIDRFTSGRVKVMGMDIKKNKAFKKHIGLVTQAKSLFKDLKVGENLDFMTVLKSADKQNIKMLIAKFELEAYLNCPVASLDYGVYQRLALACALLNSPRLLILDEPVKDIDLYSRYVLIREIKEFLQNGGRCICGISNIELCEYMDQVGWLEKGIITIYTPEAAVDNWNHIKSEYFADISGKKNA